MKKPEAKNIKRSSVLKRRPAQKKPENRFVINCPFGGYLGVDINKLRFVSAKKKSAKKRGV